MKLKIVIALMLIGFTTQQCAIGCLVCSTSNQCTLCDTTNNYFLNGTACAVSRRTNCLILGQDGNCNVCNKNFYLDQTTLNCLAVPTAKVVTNCNLYDSSQTCTNCIGNFIISGGSCMAVNQTVANCNYYAANGVCTGCATGFIISNDLKSCIAAPTSLNCLYYNIVNCKQCNPGFLRNQNLYVSAFTDPTSIAQHQYFATIPSYPLVSTVTCQAIISTNCAVSSTFDTCKQCNTGYFLQNGRCFSFPSPPIPGCLVYSTLTICMECQTGTFLNANTCQTNTLIDNCVTFDGTAPTTTCTKCSPTFFLAGNTCSKRIASINIQNCQKTTVNADTCDACLSNFALTTDKVLCLPAVANCTQYATSNSGTTALSCIGCGDGTYLTTSGSANVCTAGTVTGCQTYATNSNTCVVCKNGYYINLNSNTCTLHVVIQNCVTYSPNMPNTCTVCNTGFYNFAYSIVCSLVSTIVGCTAYTSTGATCTACGTGYYLTSGSCALIPAGNSNCLTYTTSGCTACNTGFMLNIISNTKTCVAPLDYIYSANNSACSVLDSGTLAWGSGLPANGLVLFDCQTCNNNMYGYTPQRDEAICVNNNQFNLYISFTSVPNCVRYGYNYASPGIIVCMECPSSSYINGYETLGPKTTSTSCGPCAATVGATATAIIPDDFLGFVNICIDNNPNTNAFISATNCQRYIRTASQKLNAGTGLLGDYTCLIPNQVAVSNVKGYFTLNLPTTTDATTTEPFYTYDNPSASTAVDPTDFNGGYSNTADSQSITPTVFNYKGILTAIVTLNTPNPTLLLSAGNNLNNCDIIVNYPVNYAYQGYAYYSGATTSVGIYKAALASTSYNLCLRCSFGFQLTYTAVATPANNPPFPSCTPMSNCASTGVVYGGLTTFLNSVFSCHVCAANTYPTIYFEVPTGTPSAGVWSGWYVSNVYGPTGATAGTVVDNNNGFRCASAPTTIAVLPAGASPASLSGSAQTSNFNCAAYGNIQLLTVYGAGNLLSPAPTAIKTCLACSAGYYPTYLTAGSATSSTSTVTDKTPSFVITACTQSNKCDQTIRTQFNSCGACLTGDFTAAGVPIYYGFLDYTLTNCYPSKTPNCFMLNVLTGQGASAVNDCAVCMSGYFLNIDQICETYTVLNQASNARFVNAYYTSKVFTGSSFNLPAVGIPDRKLVKAHYLLSWSRLQYGAGNCISGYTRFPPSSLTPDICVLSSYVTNNGASTTASALFTSNCLRYDLSAAGSTPVCAVCTNLYIISTDGTTSTCQAASSYPNCLIADSTATSRCKTCLENYLNVNGACQNLRIGNCATHTNTVNYNSGLLGLQCTTCTDGYYVSSDSFTCTKGSILNCKTYTQGQSGTCVACLSGFFLVGIPTNSYYCYPIPQSLNCVAMNGIPSNTNNNLAVISCKTCKQTGPAIYGTQAWGSIVTTSQAQTLCMPFTTIPNCLTYDQTNTVLTSNTFICTQCAPGYWASASTGSCIQRFYVPTQCLAYSATSDVCINCSTGFFLTMDGQACVAFPNGIFACNQYSSATVCIQCNSGYFLSNNTCIASTLTINNCQVYSANSVCSQCAQAFFLSSPTVCTVPTAVNCLTYSSLTACATCQSGFGLQTTNAVTSCVVISVVNCATPTTVSPFTCVVCNTGYYANAAGVCVLVTQTIANCLVYDTATTCSVCSPTSVLNVARTVCDSQTYAFYQDPECAQSYLQDSPVCSVCNFGSIFQNGVCTSCTNNTLASGCWSCNPANQTFCILCMPTYWMNSQGVCISANPTPGNSSTNGTVSINKALALTFVVASLFFDQL